ncbi:MAG: hypothetical protein WD557_09530 [Dehalococcoidia bacterium]
MLKKTLLLAGLAGALTLLAACGGGSSDPKPTPASNGDAGDSRQAQSSEQQPAAESKQEEPKFVGNSGNHHTCELVTDADVANVLGEAVQAGQEGTGDSQGDVTINQCTWMATATRSRAMASVFLRKSTEIDAAKVFDLGLESYPEAQKVEGLGVRAFYVPSTGQLNLLAGDGWFVVAVRTDSGGGHPDEVTPAQRQLAELVLKTY